MFKQIYDKLKFREAYIEDNYTVENPDTFHWDQEADLVIAGFGGAGAAAALEAEEQGLKTIVLDRLEGGGATTISGGIYYAGGGTSIQQEAGVDDTPENMFNYLKIEVQGAVSDETLKQFCEQSVDNFEWMKNNGVPFEASFCPFKTSYPPNQYYFYYSGNESFPPYSDAATPAARGHRAHKKGVSGAAIFEPLRDSAIKKGLDIQTQSKVVSLLTNTEGDVIGLKSIQLKNNLVAKLAHKCLNWLHVVSRYQALYWPPLFQLFALLTESIERQCGASNYIKANKGVVLATGGFYANQSMIKDHAPNFVGGSPLGTLTDDGSGIQMAQKLGAKTEAMDSVSLWRFINPPLSFAKGMLVGPTGQRICNEMLYGAQVGEQMMKKHDGKAWVILDEATYQAAYQDLSLKKGLWFHVMLGAFYILLGRKKSDSIDGLAAKINIPPQQLRESVNEYNRIANSDELDPKGKPKEYMPAIAETGPFHAINASRDFLLVPAPSLTLGGLQVNESSGLVINQQGQDIKGLYAIGRTAVGVASRGYVSGLSIADCIFSGRRAARHAANK